MDVDGKSDGTGSAEVKILERRIVYAVRRSCPAWLSHQAEDIVQNVLTQLVRKLRKSETNPGLSTIYVEKAAYGATVDAIRRLSRQRARISDADPESVERAPAPTAGPDLRLHAREIGEGIRDCLKGLIPPRRLAVTLYLQGCPVAEVAERRRWAFKRAHNLVYRGLADLRQCLERKGLKP